MDYTDLEIKYLRKLIDRNFAFRDLIVSISLNILVSGLVMFYGKGDVGFWIELIITLLFGLIIVVLVDDLTSGCMTTLITYSPMLIPLCFVLHSEFFSHYEWLKTITGGLSCFSKIILHIALVVLMINLALCFYNYIGSQLKILSLRKLSSVRNLRNKIKETRNSELADILKFKISLLDHSRQPILILRSTDEDKYFKFRKQKSVITEYKRYQPVGRDALFFGYNGHYTEKIENEQPKLGIFRDIASYLQEKYVPIILKFDEAVEKITQENFLEVPLILPTDGRGDWQTIFRFAAERSSYILIFIFSSKNLLYEISYIIKDKSLLEKTIVFMPPTENSDQDFKEKTDDIWNRLKADLEEEKLFIPDYDAQGLLYKPDNTMGVKTKATLRGSVDNFKEAFFKIVTHTERETYSTSDFLYELQREFSLWKY